jgi:hypothetical protein
VAGCAGAETETRANESGASRTLLVQPIQPAATIAGGKRNHRVPLLSGTPMDPGGTVTPKRIICPN